MAISNGSTGRRIGGGLTAVAATVVLLTGCGGSGDDGGSGEEAGASGTTSPASETPAADLASGLLTAESFGPDASVAAVTLEQLQAGTGLAAMAEGLTITPEACAGAVQQTQPDLDAFDEVAGVSATAGSVVTVEVLMQGGPTKGAVDQMAEAVERCPQAQITSPELGSLTVDFADLPVDALGDGAAAMQYTTTFALPDGTTATVPAMVGAVEDGNRLLVLVSLADPGAAAAGGAPAALDPATFTALLEEAYQVQADALG